MHRPLAPVPHHRCAPQRPASDADLPLAGGSAADACGVWKLFLLVPNRASLANMKSLSGSPSPSADDRLQQDWGPRLAQERRCPFPAPLSSGQNRASSLLPPMRRRPRTLRRGTQAIGACLAGHHYRLSDACRDALLNLSQRLGRQHLEASVPPSSSGALPRRSGQTAVRGKRHAVTIAAIRSSQHVARLGRPVDATVARLRQEGEVEARLGLLARGGRHSHTSHSCDSGRAS